MVMSSKEYFISYNRRDVLWAEWIAWTIEDIGFRVRIQVWDFLPGKAWPQEMQVAVTESAAVVCVLSPDFLKSSFASSEWQAFFADDPIGEKRLILPIRVRECRPDGLLKGRIYVDLVGKDRDEARELIEATLREKRLKPEFEPTYPGPSSDEPDFPAAKSRFALVLDGTFDEYSQARVKAVAAHLQQLLQDGSISIEEVYEGSVILVVNGARGSFQKLERVLQDNPSVEIGGASVLGAWEITSKVSRSGPLEDRLLLLGDWLPAVFLPFVEDPEDARDLSQEFLLEVLVVEDLKYEVLQNPARAASLAQALISEYIEGQARDRAVRRRVGTTTNSLPRYRILEITNRIYRELPEEERQIVEQFWLARFEGDTSLVETLREKVFAIEERVIRQLEEEL